MARDIRGIGFRTADHIAAKLGIEKTALIRVALVPLCRAVRNIQPLRSSTIPPRRCNNKPAAPIPIISGLIYPHHGLATTEPVQKRHCFQNVTQWLHKPPEIYLAPEQSQ
jgi:hypothetical protein